MLEVDEAGPLICELTGENTQFRIANVNEDNISGVMAIFQLFKSAIAILGSDSHPIINQIDLIGEFDHIRASFQGPPLSIRNIRRHSNIASKNGKAIILNNLFYFP